jgi:hypothetical protein
MLNIIEFSVKVKKTWDQCPEFGPKPSEIFFKPVKKYISIQGGNAPLFVPI